MKNIFKPLKIIQVEKFYLVWLVAIIFAGIITPLAKLLTGRGNYFGDFVSNGTVYTFALALCIPLVVELKLEELVTSKKQKKLNFRNYKTACYFFNMFAVIIFMLIWLGDYRTNIPLQIVTFILSLCMSFYMFCLCKYDQHEEQMGRVEDTYDSDEKKRIKVIQQSVNEIEKSDKDGKEFDL